MSNIFGKKTSCYLIGRGSLLIQCAEFLQKSTIGIHAIITNDKDILRWCTQNGIVFYELQNGSNKDFFTEPFDFLFSISNPKYISIEILKLARLYAINYHDSPLPKYAGVNATTWGILQNEKEWGVTWHIMTEQLDTGSILKQPRFDINPDETAFTLNGKCFGEAFASFVALISELEKNQLQLNSQNLVERSYFSIHQRPQNGIILDLKNTTNQIDCLFRALDFGHYSNPIGLIKLMLGDEFYLIRQIRARNSKHKLLPGTILEISDSKLRIAAIDGEITITEMQNILGIPVNIININKLHNLSTGQVIKKTEPELLEKIDQLYQKAATYENYWLESLTRLETHHYPTLNFENNATSKLNSNITIDISEKIKNYAVLSNISVSIIIETAFLIYLARFNNNLGFNIGFTPNELVKLLGNNTPHFFATQLPLRFDLDSSKSFAEICRELERKRQKLIDCFSFALDIAVRYPILRKNSELLSYTKYTAIIEDELPYESSLGLILFLPKEEFNDTQSIARLYFDTKRIKSVEVERLSKNLLIMMECAANLPTIPTSQLPIMTSFERDKILNIWNATGMDYPKHRCINEMFEDQALKTPNAIAIVYAEQQLTYDELNTRSNQLARYLRKFGIGPDVLVSLCVHRGINMLIGMLSILKAGGAYAPFDPSYPRDRLAFMLEDCRPKILLVEDNTENLLSGCLDQIPRINLSIDTKPWELELSTNLSTTEIGLNSKHLAYLIYTSGSTGKPKGVMVEHHSLINMAVWHSNLHELKVGDRASQMLRIGFDASNGEIWPNFICGASIYLLDDETILFSQQALQNWLILHKINIAVVPAVIGELLIKQEWSKDCNLTYLHIGGQKLHHYPIPSIPFKVVNDYGPTECTILSAYAILPNQDVLSNDMPVLPPIGQPIANTQLYILDENKELLPIGAIGEIYIAGDGLARGYLNRDDFTAEKYVINPFSNEIDARMYKTGDLGRWLENGNIEFIGRNDNQVKIRGYRIELGEIESYIAKYPDIREAVVMLRKEGNFEQLVAYYTGGTSITPDLLLLYLSGFLPDYMIPSAYIPISEIPLTANGKIDYSAFPSPNLEDFVNNKYEEPEGEIEAILAQIWSELLNKPQIGRHDNFFELGGHSLLAVTMLAKVDQAFATDLRIATAFNSPTIAKLAKVLSGEIRDNYYFSLFPVQKINSNTPPIFWVEYSNVIMPIITKLNPKLSVYGLRYGLGAEKGSQIDLPSNVEEWAAHYLDEMRKIQPKGPYFIAGHSFSGLVAFEIAQQVLLQGDSLGMLIMVDATPPNHIVFEYTALTKILNTVNLPNDKLKIKLKQWYQSLTKPKVIDVYDPQKALPGSLIEPMHNQYQPKSFFGKTLFFMASETITEKILRHNFQYTYGWLRFCHCQMHNHTLHGEHLSILAERSEEIANVISTAIIDSPKLYGKTEFLLAKIWLNFLDIKNLLRHDNFFELGGNLDLAEKMLAEINATFQSNISLNSVKHNLTIANLGVLISEANPKLNFTSLYQAQRGDSEKNIFWIDTAEINFELLNKLDKNLSVYGLRYGLMEEDRKKHLILPLSVEKWAAHYLSEIRLVQNSGPYYLIGSEFGGLLTYEIAQQLIALGEKIELLLLIDCPVPLSKDVRRSILNKLSYYKNLLLSKIFKSRFKPYQKTADSIVNRLIFKYHAEKYKGEICLITFMDTQNKKSAIKANRVLDKWQTLTSQKIRSYFLNNKQPENINAHYNEIAKIICNSTEST